MSDDSQLLRRFVEERSEAAFAAVVRRHIDFVYRAALRQVNGDGHLAQDVTQAVFLMLVRKAAEVAGHPVLEGWLFTATRHCARAAVRTERRWKNREREAHAMRTEINDSIAKKEWDQIGPVLDEALHELTAEDREAILLRYYEGKPYAEVGGRFGLTENSARMRVERALDKLRVQLGRRGIRSTAAALGVALANQPVASAPAALAGLVVKGALGGLAAGVGAGAAATAVSIMSTTKVVAVVAAVAVVGWVGFRAFEPEPLVDGEGTSRVKAIELPIAQGRNAVVAEAPPATEMAAIAVAAPEPAQAPGFVPEAPGVPPKLEPFASAAVPTNAIINNLRQLKAAGDQFRLENNGRIPTFADLVGEEPNKYIRAIRPVDGEDYSTLVFSPNGTLTVQTASGLEVSNPGTATIPSPLVAANAQAVAAFQAANGRVPTGFEVLDYFENPALRAEQADGLQRNAFGKEINAAMGPAANGAAEAFETAYRAAHGTSPPRTFQAFRHMAPYFSDSEEQRKFIETWERIYRESGGK